VAGALGGLGPFVTPRKSADRKALSFMRIHLIVAAKNGKAESIKKMELNLKSGSVYSVIESEIQTFSTQPRCCLKESV
jgi:hypothetical protein